MRTNIKNRGFTLIELMIVVVIIGILASIAIPAYSDYVISSKLIQATSQLSSMRAKMEQYYQDNRNYTNACDAAAAIIPATDTFVYDCPAHDTTLYTLRATGQPGAGLSGFVFTIDQSGVKTTAATRPSWNSSTTCWVTKKGGAC